jgi:hypothetical protein
VDDVGKTKIFDLAGIQTPTPWWSSPSPRQVNGRPVTDVCHEVKYPTFVGSEILTAVVMGDITPGSPLKFKRLFVGTCRFHLRGRRVSEGKTHLNATCFTFGFLLGLFFDTEDRSDIFLRNVV